jgi:hypothetical protein
VLRIFDKHGFVVDWLEYYLDGMKSNWNPDRTLIKIQSSVSQVFGKEYGEEVIRRLKYCLIKRQKDKFSKQKQATNL